MRANHGDSFGKLSRGHAFQGRPILVLKIRNLERVARDHLQVPLDFWIRALEDLDHSSKVEEARAERDFGQQKAVLILCDAHVLHVR